MNREHHALLDVIRAFKPDNTSDLRAALNVIMHYAETVQKQHDQIKSLEARLIEIQGLTESPAQPAGSEEP